VGVQLMKISSKVEMQKESFLNYEIWMLTTNGGLARSGVYCNKPIPTEESRKQFRDFLHRTIKSLCLTEYSDARVDDAIHCDNIVALKSTIESNFADTQVLANDEIAIGVVQKLLNLYLKYKWCLGQIPSPPHCPIDRIILNIVNGDLEAPAKMKTIPAWTKIKTIDEYKKLISLIRKVADQKQYPSIAEYELKEFQRR